LRYGDQVKEVAKIYADRQAMAAGEKLFDWGGAENLAYATLVDVRFASSCRRFGSTLSG
jgi:2-oxoglutarate dehydrogenase complex dehydrogenase (E1) component-like enzyme